jgi:glycosyltransferase involved in cell wall biosynthesis
VTELLLRGLPDADPPFHCVLWGPPEVEELAWPGAEVVLARSSPKRWLGQGAWAAVPRADLVLFLHWFRPLRGVPSVTFVYDTIVLRTARSGVERRLRHLYLRRVAATSRAVITLSEHARRAVVDDLGVVPGRVTVVRLPADERLARCVLGLRQGRAPSPFALFVGRFATHKNLRRLARAFRGSALAASGGRLVLVGGSRRERAELAASLGPGELAHLELRGPCPQEELDRLLASCLFVVQPSAEEGFGLPVWEALACGIPVCASTGGALAEMSYGVAHSFPPWSVDAMRAALDACAETAWRLTEDDRIAASESFRAKAPTALEFADQVVATVGPHAR